MRIMKLLSTVISCWIGCVASVQAQDYYAPNPWDINENTTINSGDRMHVLPGTQVNLADAVKLTIAHGGKLHLEHSVKVSAGSNASLEVFGGLIAQGTESDPVVFTSSLTEPVKGSWQGIYAYGGADISMNNSRIEYGYYGVRSYNSTDTPLLVDISFSHFEQNQYAFYHYETMKHENRLPAVHFSSFIDNTHNLHAVNLADPGDKVIFAQFNWWGTDDVAAIANKIYDRQDDNQALLVDYGSYRHSNALEDISSNTLVARFVDTSFVGGRHNFSGNIEVLGDTIIHSEQLITISSESRVHFSANAKLIIEAGAELVLEAGALVTFDENAAIEVYGRFITQGTEGNEVILKSSRTVPVKGSWQGILTHAGAEVMLHGSQVKHAVYGVSNRDTRDGAANIDIFKTLLEQNSYGLYLVEHADINLSPMMSHSAFIDNDYHVYVESEVGDSTTLIDAQYNWWGTTDIIEIAQRIVDGQDSGSGAQVNYSQMRGSMNLDDILLNTLMGQINEFAVPGSWHELSGQIEILGDTVIKAGERVVVTSGSHLYFNGDAKLMIESGANFIIESGATVLIGLGAISGAGECYMPLDVTVHAVNDLSLALGPCFIE